jgi:hypothetical protein
MPRRRGNGQTEKKIETGRKHPVATGENLAIVAEANAENSRFAPERALCPLHRFGDVRDWCSSFRMRFEFLDFFLRPRTAMRCRLLRRHEQSP